VEEERLLGMEPEIFASSLALALISLPLLARRWQIKMWIALSSAVVIGGLSGLIVGGINSALTGLGIVPLAFIELFFILSITLLALVASFYRDPERAPLETERVILSPADGAVVYVNRVERGSALVSTKGERKYRLDEITDTDLLDNAAYLVGINMNQLNVHVNRSPVEGRIILQKRIRGRFISLRKQEAPTVNERVTTIIDSGTFKIAVVQIASRLVRRIASYLGEGDMVRIGQRIGMIRLGSQVDVAIPEIEGLRINVKPGDEVRAGVSVIARYG
jgi:phosphatidylserine decarboxylase